MFKNAKRQPQPNCVLAQYKKINATVFYYSDAVIVVFWQRFADGKTLEIETKYNPEFWRNKIMRNMWLKIYYKDFLIEAKTKGYNIA